MKWLKRYGPPLLLISPSLVLLAIFVYGMLGINFQTSFQNIHSAAQSAGAKPVKSVGLSNYFQIFSSPDFQKSLINLLLFTVAFLVGTVIIGFCWAWALDRPLKGEGIFRSLFLFPMAISFIASGVVWRWLLDPQTGAHAQGLNRFFQLVGLDFIQNTWWQNKSTGILAIVLPALWQLSGYIMALFLAGFRSIPEDMREAAAVDGATGWQAYRHIIFPQLKPVALSAIIIIGHMSLKSFDLIMSISKPDIYSTKVPAIDMYVFQTMYDFSNSATVGAILLLIVAVMVVPYLIHDSKARAR